MLYYEVFVDVAENNTGRDLSDFLHIGEEEGEKEEEGVKEEEEGEKEEEEGEKEEEEGEKEESREQRAIKAGLADAKREDLLLELQKLQGRLCSEQKTWNDENGESSAVSIKVAFACRKKSQIIFFLVHILYRFHAVKFTACLFLLNNLSLCISF